MRRLVPLDEGRVPKSAIAAVRAVEEARSEKLREHAAGPAARDGAKRDGATDAAALRGWYAAEVAPRLGTIARTETARTIAVSRVYARHIAGGKVPHPRHYAALAALAGVPVPETARHR
jgi:hypothetical protein